ncbi:MAG: GNAT family N-acetyltransferase [Alphaproteobacteria bacterium]
MKFSLADKADMVSLLSLIQALYPNLGWTKDYMEWHYFENPAGQAKVWMCQDQGRAVGSVTAVPHRVWTRDRCTLGYRVQDVLTHPDYRGKSIYRTLSEECYAFLDDQENGVHFTFPNENSDRVFRTSRWFPIGEIPLWSAKPLAPKTRYELLKNFELVDSFTNRDYEVWQSFRTSGLIGLDKSADFLNWKYFKNPRVKYKCYRIAYKEWRAVLILKKFRLETGKVIFHLCDVFYSEFIENLLQKVIDFVHLRAASENAASITTWASPMDELVELLPGAGFSYTPVKTRSYFLRFTNPVIREDFAKWNIKMGDSDVY